MILIGFIVINSIFVLSALFAGDIGAIYNFDSIVIIFIGLIVSALMVFCGRFKLLFSGLKEIISFKKCGNKSVETADAFIGLSVLTIGIGVLSTIQGIYSGILSNCSIGTDRIILFASFTTIYSIDLVILLFIPLINRKR